MPEPIAVPPARRHDLLRNTLLVSALIFAALEIWRPYFFLTDDNLDGFFPFLYEVGRHLLNGHSPFISTHLFGGHYNLLRDSASFVWHPVYLLSSLLAGTPFYRAMLDVSAFFFIMLAAAGFVTLAEYLRRTRALQISDGWIMFYALSYTFSMIALTTGASWLQFLGNYSALPWLALGILQPSMWRGAGLILLFTMHQWLGGHLSPTFSSTIFLSVFAAAVAIGQRTWMPLLNWIVGYAGAVVLLSPLLIPMFHGFADSYRAQGVMLEDMQANNIPAENFLGSLLVGNALWITAHHALPHATYTLALGACAAGWCLFPALVTRAKWRPLDVAVAGMMLFTAFMIWRPVWMSQLMMHVPIMRSLRWPFRELIQFQFFFHLFLVLRPPGLSLAARQCSAWFGSLLFLVPMLIYGLPPTFNSMNWDRELILGDGFNNYWAQVRPLLKPGDRVAVLIPFDLYMENTYEEPYSLLGTYDYAALAGIVNTWGYSPTPPRDQTYTRTYAFYPFGAYRPEQKDALMAERPDLKFITLESRVPLKITLSSRDGPTIDLTPYVPTRVSQSLPP